MALLSVLLSLIFATCAQGQFFDIHQNCWGKNLDIFFVLDSSSSIWEPHYNHMVEFTKQVVSGFDVGPTRVGALSFSKKVNDPGVALTWPESKRELMDKINLKNLPYIHGLTYTNRAIDFVRNQRFRPDAAKVIVLLTDGEARGEPGDQTLEKTRWQALEAREQDGFTIFVVAVGQFQDKQEMDAMASDPDWQHVIEVGESTPDQFQSKLFAVKDQLLTDVCNVRKPQPDVPTWRPRRPTTTKPTMKPVPTTTEETIAPTDPGTIDLA